MSNVTYPMNRQDVEDHMALMRGRITEFRAGRMTPMRFRQESRYFLFTAPCLPADVYTPEDQEEVRAMQCEVADFVRGSR